VGVTAGTFSGLLLDVMEDEEEEDRLAASPLLVS
jgi:hypothetical protein